MLSSSLVDALSKLGIGGLAIGAIVLLMPPTAKFRNVVIALAMILITAIFAIDKFGPNQYWFKTGLRANWPDHDLAYTTGEFPTYKSQVTGTPFCDADHAGNIATCWDNRVADASAIASTVKDSDVDVATGLTRWCAYKSGDVNMASSQGQPEKAGVVWVCASGRERRGSDAH
jgi:hypothetical protein